MPGSGSNVVSSKPNMSNIMTINTAGIARDDDYRIFFAAVRANNKSRVEEFVAIYPSSVRTLFPVGSGKIALHVAVLAGHVSMVRLLLERMTPQDLEIEADGFTAFAEAVRQGTSIEMLQMMADMHPPILKVHDRDGMLPVARAFVRNNLKFATFLYSKTPSEMLDLDAEGKSLNGATVLTSAIRMLEFNIAAELMSRQPNLALARDFEERSPLFALACLSSFAAHPPNNGILDYLPRLRFPAIAVALVVGVLLTAVWAPGFALIVLVPVGAVALIVMAYYLKRKHRRLFQAKETHQKSMRLLSEMCVVVRSLDDGDEKIGVFHDAIMEATERGLVVFIEAIAKANPDLWASDRGIGPRVFHHAIECRHVNIYTLLKSLPLRESMVAHVDKSGNNALHIAGKLPPPHRLYRIRGGALQMQRELQWFMEVKKIMPNYQLERKNKDSKTPHQVFTDTHSDLLGRGEKWIKETSSFCVFASSLVITIMFAAAISTPGGTNEKMGFPIFGAKKPFKVFMVSDILSVFFATTSLVEFLEVNGARYAEEDFLRGLPHKITNGIVFLLLSLLTMLVAFCCIVLMMFEKDWGMSFFVLLAAFIFMLRLVPKVFNLLQDIYLSTYGPSIFSARRRMKIPFSF